MWVSVTMSSEAPAVEKISGLSGVYVSCLSLSLIGSGSVVLVSVVKRSQLSVQAKPLILLALADFLASVVLMVTVVINFLSDDTLLNREKWCNYGLPLSLMFYCISFLLVIIYACESAHAFQGRREEEGIENQMNRLLRRRRMLCLFYILVWLVPIVGYIVYIETVTVMQGTLTPANKLLTQFSQDSPSVSFCSSCILFLHISNDTCPTVDPRHQEFIQGFMLTSVLIVLISCTVVYCKLQSCYNQYENMSFFRLSHNHPGGIWSSARYMILVIIFCWAPALLLIGLSFGKIKHLFPLYVIQAMTVSLQGFLNSFAYAWRRRNFRDAVLGEQLPLTAYSNKAFYDQSLNEPS